MRRFSCIIISRFLLNLREAGDKQTPSVDGNISSSRRSWVTSSLGGSVVFAPVNAHDNASDGEMTHEIDCMSEDHAFELAEDTTDVWAEPTWGCW